MKWYLFSLFILYIVLLLVLIIASIRNTRVKNIVIKIHSDATGAYSWTRWASTIVLVVMLGMFIYQITFDKAVEYTSFVSIIGIVLGGKVTESIIKKK